jgi:hypothetical protein
MKAFLLRWLQIQLALCAVVAIGLAWLVYEYPNRLELKRRSDSDSAIAKIAASKISSLRKVVPSVQSQGSSLESAVSRVRNGLQMSNIEEQRVEDIRILGTNLIPNTKFAREDISVGLKSIELRELFVFVASQESQQGTLCSGIDLRASKAATETPEKDTWDVELIFTQIIDARIPKPK